MDISAFKVNETPFILMGDTIFGITGSNDFILSLTRAAQDLSDPWRYLGTVILLTGDVITMTSKKRSPYDEVSP